MGLEALLLCIALYRNCGNQYLLNMLVTYAAYHLFTSGQSKSRINLMNHKKEIDKREEFIIGETIKNHETIKWFNSEQHEINRYGKVLD